MNQGRTLPLHRPLVLLAVSTGVLAVLLLAAMVLDDRQLLGVSVWLSRGSSPFRSPSTR